MRTEKIDHDGIIHAALSAAGLEPDGWEHGVYGVPDNEPGEGDEYLEEIRAALPPGYTAEWSGSSDTNADGETTSDVHFFDGNGRQICASRE